MRPATPVRIRQLLEEEQPDGIYVTVVGRVVNFDITEYIAYLDDGTGTIRVEVTEKPQSEYLKVIGRTIKDEQGVAILPRVVVPVSELYAKKYWEVMEGVKKALDERFVLGGGAE
ncbi:hypothetical protein [Pyrococcus kukulkanii]|uniref:Replication protein RepA n=1 Tax=Pyrococcus kukulkanii TaxID=1609559 RepID=A0ABV4T843_9EURY